jgi:acyl-CoA synthetase (AMP-forming)/AMP-acid ligase II
MGDFLTAHAAAQPDKLAVVDDRPGQPVRTLTFAELEDDANRLGNVLAAHGAGPGGKVVWCGPNTAEVVVAINACRKVGVTAVPLNYRLSAEEAAYVVDHCDATIAVVDAEHAPMFERIRPEIPKVGTVLVYGGTAGAGQEDMAALMAAAPTTEPPVPEAEEPAATMIYTSGTTGKPKGALRRGAGDPTQLAAMVQLIGYRPDDVYLTTGPLYHSGPGGFMGIGQLLGQTVVVQRKFDPEDWLRLVTTYRCTSTFSAPTPVRMITNLPPR